MLVVKTHFMARRNERHITGLDLKHLFINRELNRVAIEMEAPNIVKAIGFVSIHAVLRMTKSIDLRCLHGENIPLCSDNTSINSEKELLY